MSLFDKVVDAFKACITPSEKEQIRIVRRIVYVGFEKDYPNIVTVLIKDVSDIIGKEEFYNYANIDWLENTFSENIYTFYQLGFSFPYRVCFEDDSELERNYHMRLFDIKQSVTNKLSEMFKHLDSMQKDKVIKAFMKCLDYAKELGIKLREEKLPLFEIASLDGNDSDVYNSDMKSTFPQFDTQSGTGFYSENTKSAYGHSGTYNSTTTNNNLSYKKQGIKNSGSIELKNINDYNKSTIAKKESRNMSRKVMRDPKFGATLHDFTDRYNLWGTDICIMPILNNFSLEVTKWVLLLDDYILFETNDLDDMYKKIYDAVYTYDTKETNKLVNQMNILISKSYEEL